MKLAIIPALLLLSAPAVAQAPPAAQEALAVCRKAFIAALNGKEESPQEIVNSVEPAKRPMVAIGCGFYFTGQADLLDVMRADGRVSI